ncbi:hypothetical protein ACLB2K_044188 [Fragaria x ananassa]
MSMLDSFFNKGFKATKCKTIPRIRLLRNRRESQIKQMRRDIAKLLETGQEATARIRVERIIREENMMAAQELIELYFIAGNPVQSDSGPWQTEGSPLADVVEARTTQFQSEEPKRKGKLAVEGKQCAAADAADIGKQSGHKEDADIAVAIRTACRPPCQCHDTQSELSVEPSTPHTESKSQATREITGIDCIQHFPLRCHPRIQDSFISIHKNT